MKITFLLILTISLTSAENAASREFTIANNLFTNDIYKEVSKNKQGNFLVSPFSAETVLAFAQSGARGETAEELRTALHLPNDKIKVESAIECLLPKLRDNGLYTLHTANKLYVKKGFTLKDDFTRAASDVYFADSEVIDFAQNVKATKTMNDWVEKQTKNKIKNLINADDVDEDTRAVLINALYFKADWLNSFQLSFTGRDSFYRTANDVIQVETLHHIEEYFNYFECPHLQAQFLELPFKGREATLVIVLPNKKDGISSLEQNLDQVFAPQHGLKSEFLNVALPKFKFETTIDFTKVLQNLGVKKIFDDNQADLSGLAGDKGDLYISKAAQKTFIDVNENGIEATAATLTLVAVPEMAPLANPKSFRADHPFIFYIKVKDLIIFAGRVTDPSKH